MFKAASGQLSKVLAGLHFAGEAGSDPDEHALACLPQSVFEKLEITVLPPAPGETAEAAPGGYAPEFLGTRIAPPALGESLREDTVQLEGSEIIPYTHF